MPRSEESKVGARRTERPDGKVRRRFSSCSDFARIRSRFSFGAEEMKSGAVLREVTRRKKTLLLFREAGRMKARDQKWVLNIWNARSEKLRLAARAKRTGRWFRSGQSDGAKRRSGVGFGACLLAVRQARVSCGGRSEFLRARQNIRNIDGGFLELFFSSPAHSETSRSAPATATPSNAIRRCCRTAHWSTASVCDVWVWLWTPVPMFPRSTKRPKKKRESGEFAGRREVGIAGAIRGRSSSVKRPNTLAESHASRTRSSRSRSAENGSPRREILEAADFDRPKSKTLF